MISCTSNYFSSWESSSEFPYPSSEPMIHIFPCRAFISIQSNETFYLMDNWSLFYKSVISTAEEQA